MPKILLELEEDYTFDLIGICSHNKDYRLSWELNQLPEFNFTKAENYELQKKGELQSHAFYTFVDEENQLDYFLINNRSENGLLLPEENKCDYLLIIKGSTDEQLKKVIHQKVITLKSVLTAYLINVENLNSKENLLF